MQGILQRNTPLSHRRIGSSEGPACQSTPSPKLAPTDTVLETGTQTQAARVGSRSSFPWQQECHEIIKESLAWPPSRGELARLCAACLLSSLAALLLSKAGSGSTEGLSLPKLSLQSLPRSVLSYPVTQLPPQPPTPTYLLETPICLYKPSQDSQQLLWDSVDSGHDMIHAGTIYRSMIHRKVQASLAVLQLAQKSKCQDFSGCKAVAAA